MANRSTTASAEGGFAGGPQKALLRSSWDLPIIAAHRLIVARPLRYFGMPGPAIEDIQAWRSELDHVTAVELFRRRSKNEDGDRERIRRLTTSLLQTGLDFQLLRGWVEDVLIQGRDTEDQAPQWRAESDGITRLRYDVINLDFCGGAGYPSTKTAAKPKRIRALQELFRRQHGTSFVLLLTLNVRDKVDEGLTEYLTLLRSRVEVPLQGVLDWYAHSGDGMKRYRLKAGIPAFLQRVAEDESFDVECLPAVAYSGTSNATMVHFVLRCTPTTAPFHSVSAQTLGDLIRLPLLTCTEGEIGIDAIQHPGFDWRHCYDRLANLPTSCAATLQAQALERLGGEAA